MNKKGTQAPGEETFKFEVVGFQSDVDFDLQKSEAKADGKGDFAGEMKIVIPKAQIGNFCEGFIVRETKETKEGWVYSDAIWFVQPQLSPNSGAISGYKFQKLLSVDQAISLEDEDFVSEMVFVNTYTANASVTPTDPTNPRQPSDNPKTGDNSNIPLMMVMMFAGIGGLLIIGFTSRKRRRSTRAM